MEENKRNGKTWKLRGKAGAYDKLVGRYWYVSWLTSFRLNQKVVIRALTNCNDHKDLQNLA